MPGRCPTPERLAAALRGLQRTGDEEELAAHVAECSACQARLEALAGGSGWLTAESRRHTATTSINSEPLRQAMRELELESRSAELPQESPSPPRLDFLRPSDQSGVLGTFGPYEVIEHVASGGMGIVLKARDPVLDRIVALKILPPALSANALARARFVREARAAAAVVHEHVVPIYAVDECAGLPYIVMQFVKGRPLSERIKATGPLHLEEILRIATQTAAGLAAAHAQGLIHRDVKPGNILLENSVERVKLTDFGLARAVDDAGLTRTGELAGTPEFMAPEQAGNEAVDHRADLFSLGSVLYAMATGTSPFQGNTVIAVIRNVCDAHPRPVHQLVPSIPRWLGDLIARLMAKSPAERFQSAEEVGELLGKYLSRVQHGDLRELPGTAGRPVPAARLWKRGIWGAITVSALVAILFLTLKDWRPTPSTGSPPTTLREPFLVRSESGASVGAFLNLASALDAAPAGAIVELCWTGPRELEPVLLPSRPLTLRAGRGFQPAWITRDSSASALSASAALTLEDIRFVLDARADEEPVGRRGGRRGPFQPLAPAVPPSSVALVSVTNGALRATRCLLDVRQTATNDLACLILANAGECRLESTLLFARRNKGVVWHQRASRSASGALERAQPGISLALTNCVAFAGEVIWLDLEEPARGRIELVRCTFTGPTGFYLPPDFAVTSLEVESRHNLFDTSRMIYDARDAALPALPQRLTWRDHENLFSPVRRYVVTAPPMSDSGPSTLQDWNQWWNQTGDGSRQVLVAFDSGRSDTNPGFVLGPAETSGFRVTDLRVVEGPPLPKDQWSRFGADTATVGPALKR